MKYVPWIIGGVAALWLVTMLAKSDGKTAAIGSTLIAPGQGVGTLVSATIAPGQTALGTVNSTGGFTILPDPNGIGGGFAT